jgi:hypothetical protein
MKSKWDRSVNWAIFAFCATFVVASVVLATGYLALHSWRMP